MLQRLSTNASSTTPLSTRNQSGSTDIFKIRKAAILLVGHQGLEPWTP